jgi:hypothetical protein
MDNVRNNIRAYYTYLWATFYVLETAILAMVRNSEVVYCKCNIGLVGIFFCSVALLSLKDLGCLTYRRFLELFRHMVGLLGWVISPSQGLYLHRTTRHRKTQTNIHALSGIQTHDPSNQPAKTHASERTATVTGSWNLYQWIFEILTVVKMTMLFSWTVTQCELVDRYQRFGDTYSLHLQGWRWGQYVPLKRWYLPISPHGVTTHNNNIVIPMETTHRNM